MISATGTANYGALRLIGGGVFSTGRTSPGLVETIKNMGEEVNVRGAAEMAKDAIKNVDLEKNMTYVSERVRSGHPPLIGDNTAFRVHEQRGRTVDTYA